MLAMSHRLPQVAEHFSFARVLPQLLAYSKPVPLRQGLSRQVTDLAHLQALYTPLSKLARS